jgi:hypothetical protein
MDSNKRDSSTVSVGFGSAAGFTGSMVAFVLAIIAFINGDRTEETVTALVVGTILLVTTIAGRFWQAKAKDNAAAIVEVEKLRQRRDAS